MSPVAFAAAVTAADVVKLTAAAVLVVMGCAVEGRVVPAGAAASKNVVRSSAVRVCVLMGAVRVAAVLQGVVC